MLTCVQSSIHCFLSSLFFIMKEKGVNIMNMIFEVIPKYIGLYLILTITLLTLACTYSINMVHTEGVASDVVDEEQSATADITPTLNIPWSAMP